MRPCAHPRGEAGFSIIEVLVAALVLVIGITGTVGLLASANSSTVAASSTEGATNLAREITEKVRRLPFSDLTPAALNGRLQALPALASTSGGPAWTVTRRSTTYTIVTDVCSVDDPKDGLGSHAGATFCSDTGAAGSGDASPQDFARVKVDVTWRSKGSATRRVRQVVLVSAKGADGPAISTLVATSPAFPKPAAPVVSSTAVTTVSFRLTADTRAAQVVWLLNGEQQGNATPVGNGTDWTFSFDVSAKPDDNYEVAAQAIDARGVPGPTFFIPLLVNRYAPTAPTGVVGAMNTVYIGGVSTPVAEIQWDSEVKAIGYRVYRPNGTLACPADLQTFDDETECLDPNPVDGEYEVATVYQNAAGTVLETPRTKTSTKIIASPMRTWIFKDAINYTGLADCNGADRKADMVEGWSGGGEKNVSAAGNDDLHRFCAPVLAASETAVARDLRVVVFFKNDDGAGNTCPVTVSVKAGAVALPGVTQNVTPAGTSVVPYTFTWPIGAPTTVPAGAQPIVQLDFTPGIKCEKTKVYYSSAARPSRLEVPVGYYPEPKPVTNVTSASTADGLQLNWTVPTTGIEAEFFRIYRDGYDIEDRYDETEDAIPTYTDPDREPGSHTYYVTAVSGTLQESDPTPLPPATFP